MKVVGKVVVDISEYCDSGQNTVSFGLHSPKSNSKSKNRKHKSLPLLVQVPHILIRREPKITLEITGVAETLRQQKQRRKVMAHASDFLFLKFRRDGED